MKAIFASITGTALLITVANAHSLPSRNTVVVNEGEIYELLDSPHAELVIPTCIKNIALNSEYTKLQAIVGRRLTAIAFDYSIVNFVSVTLQYSQNNTHYEQGFSFKCALKP